MPTLSFPSPSTTCSLQWPGHGLCRQVVAASPKLSLSRTTTLAPPAGPPHRRSTTSCSAACSQCRGAPMLLTQQWPCRPCTASWPATAQPKECFLPPLCARTEQEFSFFKKISVASSNFANLSPQTIIFFSYHFYHCTWIFICSFFRVKIGLYFFRGWGFIYL
jgi:hypothetical protein